MLTAGCSPAVRDADQDASLAAGSGGGLLQFYDCICQSANGCTKKGFSKITHQKGKIAKASERNIDSYRFPGSGFVCQSYNPMAPVSAASTERSDTRFANPATIAAPAASPRAEPTIQGSFESCSEQLRKVPETGYLYWDPGPCSINQVPTADSGLPWAGKDIKAYSDNLRNSLSGQTYGKTPGKIYLCYCTHANGCAVNHPRGGARIMDEYDAFFFKNPLNGQSNLGLCQAVSRPIP
jgi:hypothetical protein